MNTREETLSELEREFRQIDKETFGPLAELPELLARLNERVITLLERFEDALFGGKSC